MHLRKSFAPILLLAIVPTLLSQAPRPAPKPVSPLTLASASARGLIEYTFAGTGASSGDSIRLTVSKTAKAAGRSLSLDLPTGSILRSADPRSRSMVVGALRGVDMGGGRLRPASVIYLGGGAPVIFVISAFFAEFEKANPPPGAGFTLEAPNSAPSRPSCREVSSVRPARYRLRRWLRAASFRFTGIFWGTAPLRRRAYRCRQRWVIRTLSLRVRLCRCILRARGKSTQ